VTESESGARQERGTAKCAWCGRSFTAAAGPGRPRRFCKRSCRQRDFEARQRVRSEGLADDELVVTRRALSTLDDLVYVLACAVEDVERDLAGEHDAADLTRSLDWMLEAARPLAERSRAGTLLPR
jgi:hypothetical protein